MRIYFIGTPQGEQRLIRAQTRQQALLHVIQGKYVVRPAGQDELVTLLGQGTEVENVIPAEQTKLEF
mgnify:FL=1